LIQEQVHLALAAAVLEFFDNMRHDGFLEQIPSVANGNQCYGACFQS
jgi:hypothetical protein